MKCRQLIEEATAQGARLRKAREVVRISVRTFQRWRKDMSRGDRRCGRRGSHANILREVEKAAIIAVATLIRFRDLPPSQIVPILADEGISIASESGF